MANDKFDAKSFNPQAFKYTVDRVPRTRLNDCLLYTSRCV